MSADRQHELAVEQLAYRTASRVLLALAGLMLILPPVTGYILWVLNITNAVVGAYATVVLSVLLAGVVAHLMAARKRREVAAGRTVRQAVLREHEGEPES